MYIYVIDVCIYVKYVKFNISNTQYTILLPIFEIHKL